MGPTTMVLFVAETRREIATVSYRLKNAKLRTGCWTKHRLVYRRQERRIYVARVTCERVHCKFWLGIRRRARAWWKVVAAVGSVNAPSTIPQICGPVHSLRNM